MARLIQCPDCGGSGEVSAPWSLEGPPTEGCKFCLGEGFVKKDKIDKRDAQDASMKDMSDMQAFEDRISPPIEGDD